MKSKNAFCFAPKVYLVAEKLSPTPQSQPEKDEVYGAEERKKEGG